MEKASEARGLNSVAMDDHHEVVESHHRFSDVSYKGADWDLSHLDAFAMRLDPGLGFEVDVVILFSCHCFSKSFKRDGRPRADIPDDEVFDNGREQRVLCPERYEHSKQFLPRLVKELSGRTIQVAATDRQNFVTFEERKADGSLLYRYAMYFEVTRDTRRKKRLLLHVQSAYVQQEVSKRQKNAGKVSFANLLRAAYAGRKIKG